MNQDHFNYPLIKLGIIGGGQLGKMTAQEAKKMGIYVTILDPSDDCPAAQFTDKLIIGDLYDKSKLSQLIKESDVTTYEIEHINTEVLKQLEDANNKIYPSPYLLNIIQDKLKQKNALKNGGIPVSNYENVESC